MTRLTLIASLKALSSNTDTLGVKSSTYEFEEDGVQFIRWPKLAALAHTLISIFQPKCGGKKREDTILPFKTWQEIYARHFHSNSTGQVLVT